MDGTRNENTKLMLLLPGMAILKWNRSCTCHAEKKSELIRNSDTMASSSPISSSENSAEWTVH